MRVYFAHSMQTYDSLKEKQDLKFLREKFDNVLCPNKDIGQAGRGMPAYLKIVQWADLVIASEYGGFIGVGVFQEIQHALNMGISVKCLRGKKLLDVKEVVIHNPRDRRIRYGKVIV